MLAQDVADARAVPAAERGSADGDTRLSWVGHDEGGVVLDSRARVERAQEVVDLLAGGPRRRAPRPSCSSKRPMRATSGARRKMVNEIARFQRFSRVRAPGRAPRMRRTTVSSTARPVSPSSAVAGEPPRDALEQIGGEDAVVVGKSDEIGACRSRAALRARESPRWACSRTRSNEGCSRRTGSRRSSSFWSTSRTRTARCVCAWTEASRRSSSATRSTVATTRSNEGSRSSATRRTLTARAPRLRSPRRSQRVALPQCCGRERAGPDRGRPRAGRDRRRLNRRNAGSAGRSRRPTARHAPQRGTGRARRLVEPRPRGGERALCGPARCR